MSRCYLDTNFIYAHLRSKRGATLGSVEAWRTQVLSEMDDGGGVISGLVLDEIAYHLVLAWLRDDGDSDPLSSFRADPERVVVERAKSLMARPGLPPRDAFHAGHALEAGCDLIASSDTDFDRVPGLRLLAP